MSEEKGNGKIARQLLNSGYVYVGNITGTLPGDLCSIWQKDGQHICAIFRDDKTIFMKEIVLADIVEVAEPFSVVDEIHKHAEALHLESVTRGVALRLYKENREMIRERVHDKFSLACAISTILLAYDHREREGKADDNTRRV